LTDSNYLPSDAPDSTGYLSVSEFNQKVASLLERTLPLVSVTGEISNFTRAASGHLYFAIKDHSAQVRCVMFRGRAAGLGFSPREGDKVQLRALASFYQSRGEFQLTVEQLKKAGAGGLYEEFLVLKAKLMAEGLFAGERKRTLPAHVRRIGVVTSLQAAALKDVIAALARRAPQVAIVIYPCAVQGRGSENEIARAIQAASQRAVEFGEIDVMLVVRGGGSIEDLWSFNSEVVARAIAQSSVPVISGVGHETDTTIADFVADLRAPTPTAAAELATPERAVLMADLNSLAVRLSLLHTRAMRAAQQSLDLATSGLQSPARQWQAKSQLVEQHANRLAQSAKNRSHFLRLKLDGFEARLRFPSLENQKRTLESRSNGLQNAMQRNFQKMQQSLANNAQALELLGPPAVLARGYAIVRNQTNQVIRSAGSIQQGQALEVLLNDGQINVVVR
jgi:exodeoxyribonuclease VII large subunit